MSYWISIIMSISMMIIMIPVVDLNIPTTSEFELKTIHTDGSPIGSDPIAIDDELDLISLVSDNGWPGNGSMVAPYVISNLTIDAKDGGYGIYIGNSTLHLIIENLFIYNSSFGSSPYHSGSGILVYRSFNISVRNCSILKCTAGITVLRSENIDLDENNCRDCTDGLRITESKGIDITKNQLNDNAGHGAYLENTIRCQLLENQAKGNDLGLFLDSCLNNRIENNTCNGNDDHGIRLDGSDSNIIIGNRCMDNDDGVHLYMSSSGNIIRENVVLNSIEYGLYIENSHGNIITGNRMINCSFMIIGDRMTYISQIIPVNNTVNGDPVFYLINRNMSGETGPSGAGQIILANITGAALIGARISNVSCGITIAHSSNVTIRNSIIENAIYYGLNIDISTDIEITGCTMENNLFSIYIEDSSHCTMIRNNITESGTALQLEGSDQSIIHENYIGMNSQGIVLRDETRDSQISGNFIFLHEWSGISIQDGCENIYVIGNDLHYLEPGLEIFNSRSVHIRRNDFAECRKGISVISSSELIIEENDLIDCTDNCLILKGANNLVRSNMISTDDGICLELGGSDNRIENNSIHSYHGTGIVSLGDRNTIINNRIETPNKDGIQLYYSSHNRLESNELVQCSIGITGDLTTYESSSIPPNNTVNGDPIYHMIGVNTISGDLLKEAGEIIAVSVDDLLIKDIDSTDTTSLIIMKDCQGGSVSSSRISSRVAIQIEDCRDVSVNSSTFIGGDTNIRIRSCDDMDVLDCSFVTSENGISFDNSKGGSISWSVFESVGNGILTSYSESLRISNNTIDCKDAGIFIDGGSSYIQASDNIIMGGTDMGILIMEEVQFCNITHNTFHGGTSGQNKAPTNRFYENYWEISDPIDLDGDGVHDEAWNISGNRSADPRPLLYLPETTLPSPEITISDVTWPNARIIWEPPERTRHKDIFNFELVRTLNNGSILPVAIVAGGDGMVSADIRNEGENYTYSARYRIDYGPSRSSDPITILPDWYPPVISPISPEYGVHINRSYVLISWDHHDNISGVDHVRINHRYYHDYPEFPLPEIDLWKDIGISDSHQLEGLADGYHFVTVRAYDPFGHYSDEIFHFVVDTTAPDLDIISPLNGTLLNEDFIDMEISWKDALSIDYTIIVTIDVRRSIIWEFDNPDIFGNYYDHIEETIDNLDDRIHEISVECSDTAGNTAKRSVIITVDTVNPVVESHYPDRDGIELDSEIWIEFSEQMDRNATYATINSNSVTEIWNGTRMYLEPPWSLHPSREYIIEYHGTDLAGNGIMGEIIFSTIEDPDTDWGYLNLMVRDSNGKTLEDARVIFDGSTLGYTDDDGVLKIVTREGSYDLSIEKEGYRTYRRTVEIEIGITIELDDIIMESDDSSGVWIDPLLILEISLLLSFILMIAASVSVYIIMEKRSIPKIEE